MGVDGGRGSPCLLQGRFEVQLFTLALRRGKRGGARDTGGGGWGHRILRMLPLHTVFAPHGKQLQGQCWRVGAARDCTSCDGSSTPQRQLPPTVPRKGGTGRQADRQTSRQAGNVRHL
jgi:hypothetical protein